MCRAWTSVVTPWSSHATEPIVKVYNTLLENKCSLGLEQRN